MALEEKMVKTIRYWGVALIVAKEIVNFGSICLAQGRVDAQSDRSGQIFLLDPCNIRLGNPQKLKILI